MSGRFETIGRAAALTIILNAAGASLSAAQTQPALGSPAFEERIRGKRVVITTSDGTEREGVFTVSPTGLVGPPSGPAIVVPYDRIVRVELASQHFRNWTLIGLGAGAGVGVVMTKDAAESAPVIPILGAGVGTGVGALIGGVVAGEKRKTDVIYDVRRRSATMSLAPIVSRTHRGISVLMTWR